MNNIQEQPTDNCFDVVSGFRITIFDKFKEQCNGFLNGSHRLSAHQIVMLTRGTGHLQLDNQKCTLRSHSLFAAAKGQVEMLELSEDARGYIILFSDEYLCKYPEDMAWISHLSLLEHTTAHCTVQLDDLEFTELLMLLRKMHSEFELGNEFAQRDILVNAFRMFLLMTERAKRKRIQTDKQTGSHIYLAFPPQSEKPEATTATNSADDKDWQYIVAFRRELEQGFHASRSVLYYANQLHITQKKLNHVTGKFLGKPAKKIIEDRVLLETKRLLIYTNNTIKEIGFSMGFSDPTNFNKFFKKYTLRTPVQFRQSADK